jgi:microcystin-dependent protein
LGFSLLVLKVFSSTTTNQKKYTMDDYLAEIRLFAGNFAPLNWAFCNGATLAIAEYDTLFALIGTTYGGDGVTTFKLPDLQGRVPVGTGQGLGLAPIVLGETGGAETVTMTINQMPQHTHVISGSASIPAYSGLGDSGSPTDTVLAGLDAAYSTIAADTTLKPESTSISVSTAGASNPFSIVQPYLSTNYIICVRGIFPSRN